MKFLAVILCSLMLVSCGGGGGGGGDGNTFNPTGGTSVPSTAVPLQGQLSVAPGDNAATYTVTNSIQSSSTDSNGTFSTTVATSVPTYTFAVAESGNKVYASVNTSTDSAVTIDAQSTAEAMVLMNPLLIPSTVVEKTKIINLAKADAAVKTLASVISSVYASSADPLSDPRISDALANAVASVLTSWQAATATAAPIPIIAQAAPAKLVAPVRLAASTVSQNVSTWWDVSDGKAVLTMPSSVDSNLLQPKLKEFPLSVLGEATVNVDWVFRVVELDRTKISTENVNLYQTLSSVDIDSLIKPGGFDENYVINGSVGSGAVALAINPIGQLIAGLGEKLFPDNGIALPHDGTYAVVAFSGSPAGDTNEFSGVVKSSWQAKLAKKAYTVNVCHFASDIVGILDLDISAACVALEVSDVTNAMQANSDYFIEQALNIAKKEIPKMAELASKSGSSSIRAAVEKLITTCLQSSVATRAKAITGLWSGVTTGVNVSTRAVEYFTKVTPREYGVAALRTFSVPPVCSAGQVLSGGVCVTPPVTCTLPQVLTNGQCVAPPPIACTLPQVLTNGVCVTPALTSQTITFNSPGNQTIGVAPPTLLATSTSGLPVTLTSSTQLACTVNGSTLTLVAAGTCTITATQGGNASYAAATAVSRSFSVQAPASVTFSLSLITSGTGSGTISYTGGYVCPASCAQTYNQGATVTFTANASAGSTFSGWLGACSGTSSCTVTMDAAKSVTVVFVVNPVALLAQIITFNSPGNQTIGVTPPILMAASTSGLLVSLTSSTQSVCMVSGTVLTLVAPGSCTITAVQAGDATYAAATPVPRTFTIAAAASQPTSVIAGNWLGSGSDSSGPGTFNLTFFQTGSTVTGNGLACNTSGTTCFTIASISVAASSSTSFSGVMNAVYYSCVIAINFSANVVGTQMSATYSGTNTCAQPFSGGVFALQKQTSQTSGSRFSTVGIFPLTDCVKDNTTGLTWEGKPSSGLRASGNSYTNYDSTAARQVWLFDINYATPTQNQVDAATNSVGYRKAVNTSGLCGYADWRLPTLNELQSIVVSGVGSPSIDSAWFPNTKPNPYWTSSPVVDLTTLQPDVGFAGWGWFVYFSNGASDDGGRGNFFPVRLVR